MYMAIHRKIEKQTPNLHIKRNSPTLKSNGSAKMALLSGHVAPDGGLGMQKQARVILRYSRKTSLRSGSWNVSSGWPKKWKQLAGCPEGSHTILTISWE